MRLSALIRNLPEHLAPVDTPPLQTNDPVIRGIGYDSRQISPGDLFVALPGSAHDGHDYIERAIALGAVAILSERPAHEVPTGDTLAIRVPDTRRALAFLSVEFFGAPSSDLELVGITGTNGKTSTSYLTESILAAAGFKTGLIGTIEVRYSGERIDAVNTTPESLDLQRTLRAMATSGVSRVVMEVSSHGLELGRVTGCEFKVAAFTNLTQDHLDFHGNMESYLASKAILFRDLLGPEAWAVLNVDDPHAEALAEITRAKGINLLRCSRKPGNDAEVELLDATVKISGTRATVALHGQPLELKGSLVGDYNLENLLVACGIASALGIAPEHIARGVEQCPQVPGRMEVVQAPIDPAPTVIVDYAHTPDAIEKLLAAVRPLCSGRIITVFGCGGDRDRSKRPLMAQAVARQTDLAIATSDNPRTEEPSAILNDVETGLTSLQRMPSDQLGSREASYSMVEDRRDAIDRAIGIARAGDTVVVAGKGHEDYQIMGTEKRPFDDRLEARRALEKWVAT